MTETWSRRMTRPWKGMAALYFCRWGQWRLCRRYSFSWVEITNLEAKLWQNNVAKYLFYTLRVFLANYKVLLIFDQQSQWKTFIGIVSIRSPDAVLPFWGLDTYWTRYTFSTTVFKWKHVKFNSPFLAFLNHKKEMVSQWMKHHSDGVIRSTIKFTSQWRLSFKFFVIDFFLSNAGRLHHKLA